MNQIRWDELSEARQLARLGKSLSRAARTRLQWMLFYRCNGRNAARTCRHFGISRQTFYRWWRRFDRHDLSTLEERSHRPRKIRQPTWTAASAARILAWSGASLRWLYFHFCVRVNILFSFLYYWFVFGGFLICCCYVFIRLKFR